MTRVRRKRARYISAVDFNCGHNKMNAPNGFSDSQESALLDDETFSVLEPHMKELEEMDPNIKLEFLEDCDATMFVTTEKKMEKEQVDKHYSNYISVPKTFYINFDYKLPDGGTGQDWIYSTMLDKVFIKMEKTLPILFICEPQVEGLLLRAAMVFKLEQYKSDPVKRCHNHMATICSMNQDMDSTKIKHVVHCVNHPATFYEERNEHLSIVTPFSIPEQGSRYVLVCYKFLCKNSCPSGMNRRPTELIFTIEDFEGTTLGRRKLLVRVCSCPKRDKKKEEDESVSLAKRKAPNNSNLLPTKKVASSCDKHVFKVDIDVVGKENYLSVLKYAHDVMAGQAVRTGQYDLFKPYMEKVLHKMP